MAVSTLKPNAGAHYPAHLYQHDQIAARAPGWDAASGLLEHYAADGFLAIGGAFTPAEVAAALAGLDDLINGGYPNFKGISFEDSVSDRLAELTPDERAAAVRKLMYFCSTEARLKALAYHPRLIALLTAIMGSAPRMIQDMAMLKPPLIGREKPWHQDLAYFDLPIGTPVVGVWIALDEATLDNGCMRMVRGAHRAGPQLHFQRRDWQICDTEIPTRGVTACPLLPGDLLLFDGLIPHGTPYNNSPLRRRAVQFHYAPASAPTWSTEERLKVFGGEGRNVEC